MLSVVETLKGDRWVWVQDTGVDVRVVHVPSAGQVSQVM